MARLYIVNTNDLGRRDGALVPVFKLDADTTYSSVSFTSTAGTSAAQEKRYVRLLSDANCHVAVGETAVRTAGSEVGVYLPAFVWLDIAIEPGDTISVVTVA